jgi:hypothetical protein
MRGRAFEKITGRDFVESLMKQAITPGMNLCKLKGLDVKIETDRSTFMTTMVNVSEAMSDLDRMWDDRRPRLINSIAYPILNMRYAGRVSDRANSTSDFSRTMPFIVADQTKPNQLYIAKPGSITLHDQLVMFKHRIDLNSIVDRVDANWRDQMFSSMFLDAFQFTFGMLSLDYHDIINKLGTTVWNDETALLDFKDGTKFTCADVVENGWFKFDDVAAAIKGITNEL